MRLKRWLMRGLPRGIHCYWLTRRLMRWLVYGALCWPMYGLYRWLMRGLCCWTSRWKNCWRHLGTLRGRGRRRYDGCKGGR
jgi:hypothetical protein